MNDPKRIELLILHLKIKKPFELRVAGTSMLPTLHEGETVTVCRKDEYMVGDILVFIYKHGELLVHRLLKKENGRFFCKGDNSFRLEDVDAAHIIGAVTLDGDKRRSNEFIEASFQISRVFRKYAYDPEKVKTSPEYLSYKGKYLEDRNEVY